MNTSKYFAEQKLAFTLRGDYDSYISEFLTKLNKYEDIVTFFSCEGFHDKDEEESSAYLYFNVSAKIWVPFWSAFMPAFLCECAHYISVSVVDMVNKLPYTGGISLHCEKAHYKKIFWTALEKELISFLDKHSTK
jgi:hypothetical protein